MFTTATIVHVSAVFLIGVCSWIVNATLAYDLAGVATRLSQLGPAEGSEGHANERPLAQGFPTTVKVTLEAHERAAAITTIGSSGSVAGAPGGSIDSGSDVQLWSGILRAYGQADSLAVAEGLARPSRPLCAYVPGRAPWCSWRRVALEVCGGESGVEAIYPSSRGPWCLLWL